MHVIANPSALSHMYVKNRVRDVRLGMCAFRVELVKVSLIFMQAKVVVDCGPF